MNNIHLPLAWEEKTKQRKQNMLDSCKLNSTSNDNNFNRFLSCQHVPLRKALSYLPIEIVWWKKKKKFNFECMNFIKISITSPLTCVLRHMLQ